MKINQELIRRHPAFFPFVGFWLICMWPGLHFLGQNAGQIRWVGGAGALVVLVLCGVILLAGAALAVLPRLVWDTWPTHRVFTVGIMGVFLLFSHEAIRTLLRPLTPILFVPRTLVYSIILIGALAATWRASRHEVIRVLLVITAALLALFPLRQLLPAAVTTLAAPTANGDQPLARSAVAEAVSTRNVYYIILDGYAGPSALRTYFDYDIDPFLLQMGELGYMYGDSVRANYTTTHLTLAAILEADYILDEGSARYVDRFDFFPHSFQHPNPPSVPRNAFLNGYEFYYVGSPLAPCVPRPGLRCLSSASRVGYWSHVASTFMSPTGIPRLIRRVSSDRLSQSYDAITPLSEALGKLIARERPFFAFVHHVSPHRPYRREDCSLQPEMDDVSNWGEEEARRQYLESIVCVNRRVRRFARRIEILDPTAIVVFQADHGTDFGVVGDLPMAQWTYAMIDESSSIFNLVRVPQQCRRWLRPDLSQINTMRLVFACLEGRPPTYVEERTFLGVYEGNPDFGRVRDVTEQLRKGGETQVPR